MLSDLASALRLTVCNVGVRPTYRRVNAASVIDVTLERALPSHHPLVTDWLVEENAYSGSDHQYITYRVSATEPRAPMHEQRGTRTSGWSVKKLNPGAVAVLWELTGPPRQLPEGASASHHADRLGEFLRSSCDAAMPRRAEFKARRSVHWWNDNIANLRKTAIAARRAYQRAGRRSDHAARAVELVRYNKARSELKLAIRKAQEESWRDLCRLVDADPWGLPYRLITKRLGRRSPALDSELKTIVVRGLFPSQPHIDWSGIPSVGAVPVVVMPYEFNSAPRTPLFTMNEVTMAVDKLPVGKAPGPDLVPNEMIKLAFRRFPQIFVDCYNACLERAEFPTRWKQAKLVLLYKGQNKPKDVPSSYRPISLLDGAGKVLERLILDRINRHVESAGALSDCQFGFRQNRSTIDAIKEVIRTAEAAGSGAVQNRDLCVLITLDVKNAFNSAPWRLIDAALQRYAAPKYLVEVLRAYMSHREIVLSDDCRMPVTCGVPQGSVLGPTLWNLFYDDVLRLPVRDGIKLIAFADDLAIVATAHNAELIEEAVNPTISEIVEWMNSNGLQLAPEKSECVVITKKYVYRAPDIRILGCRVPVHRAIRYLGVQLDTRLTFGDHVAKVTAGAKKAAAALGRLMPNVGGPAQCKRSLLMSVVHSRLLYGATIWADGVQQVAKYTNLLLQTQRCAALRVARCYRTVSDMAALVLARMPPVTLQAAARARSTAAKRAGAVLTRQQIDDEIIEQWQKMWEATPKAVWTKRLIPDLRKWWKRGPKEISFHMAQALTGHGSFQDYLWRRKRARDPGCVHCTAEVDDVKHTIFDCPYWSDMRENMEAALRRPIGPEDVPYLLCGPDPQDLPEDQSRRRALTAAARLHRDLFHEMVETILTEKETMERERQRHI